MEEKVDTLIKMMEVLQQENREMKKKIENLDVKFSGQTLEAVSLSEGGLGSQRQSEDGASGSTSSTSHDDGLKKMEQEVPLTPSKKRIARRRKGKGDRDSLLANDGSPAAKALKSLKQKEGTVQTILAGARESNNGESKEDDYDDEDERVFQKTLCNKPPFFTGSKGKVGDATVWISIVEQICESLGIDNEEDKVDIATSYLRDDARQWWNNTGKKTASCGWKIFKDLFLAMFERVDVQEYAKKQFYSLKQGDMSVRDFHMKFCSMANLIPNLSEATRTELYVYGLNEKIRDHLLASDNVDTFEKASIAALRRGQILEGRKGKAEKGGSSWKKDRPMGRDVPSQAECWNCGRKGHKREECRSPPRQQGIKPGPVKPWEKKHLAAMDAPEAPPPTPSAATPTVSKQGNERG
jgi:hypothetical protein